MPDVRDEVLKGADADETALEASRHVILDVSPSWWHRGAVSRDYAEILPVALGAALQSWRSHAPKWAGISSASVSRQKLTLDIVLWRSSAATTPDLETATAMLEEIRSRLIPDVEKAWTPPPREPRTSPE